MDITNGTQGFSDLWKNYGSIVNKAKNPNTTFKNQTDSTDKLGSTLMQGLSVVSPYGAAFQIADSLIAGINGGTDTTDVGGGAGFINNLASSTIPGLSGLFAKKMKDFKFESNASYKSLDSGYNKINANKNKKLLPFLTNTLNTQGDALLKQSNKIKGLSDQFKTRSSAIASDTLLTQYLNSVNPHDYSRTRLIKDGAKISQRNKNVNNVVELKLGGSLNVIPEGALHARKHTIDKEELSGSITSKGIPVISKEEGGDIVQHAEIERDEIIFTLEVTKKLEELAKKSTDEAAIEAGKLLVEEILNNTDDRTGLIKEIE